MEIAGANPEWAIGFEDECWWSRVALPTLKAWSEEDKPLRLLQRSVPKDDDLKSRRPLAATVSSCLNSTRRG